MTISHLDANFLKKVSPVSVESDYVIEPQQLYFVVNQNLYGFFNTEIVNQGRKVELLGQFQPSTVADYGRENNYAGSIFTTANEWSGIMSFAAFGRREGFSEG